jgi:hypothetical protein
VRHSIAHCALGLAILCHSGLPAAAQEERVYQSARALSGKEVRLALFGRVDAKECKPLQLPDIQVIAPPKSGALTIRVVTITTTRYPNCPNLKLPAQVIFYRSAPDYIGSDSISFTVTFENGQKQAHSFAITVTKEGQPSTAQDL